MTMISKLKQYDYRDFDDVYKQFQVILSQHTIAETAKMTEVSQPTITKWRCCNVVPSLSTAVEVLNKLGYDFMIIKKESENNEVEM